jgi:N-acyl-D-aspartate/D-glutamate deacylase
MFDLLLTDGIIVDGTGGPWYRGDVGIKDSKIAQVGSFKGAKAKKVLSVDGHIISPGFIDSHTHSDIIATEISRPENQIYQGVTSQIAGNCGKSNGPVNPATVDLLKRYLDAYTPKEATLKWDWVSLGDWMDIIDRQGYVTDLGVLLGQGTIRIAVMGMDDGEPTKDQIESMKKLVAEAMRQGAVGLSSGLIYPPGSFTRTWELIELCKVVAQFGRIYTSHIRSEGPEELEAVDEAIEIGRRSGCRVQISHHKVMYPNQGFSQITLKKIEAARAEGIDVACDVYPYLAGYSQITTLIPKWATVGGVDAMLERLKDPEVRRRIAEDHKRDVPGWENFAKAAGWDNLFISSTKVDKSVEGKRISEIARERDLSCSEALIEIVLKERAQASVIIWSLVEEDHKSIVTHPFSMIGSDGFPCSYSEPRLQGKPHPRCLATCPRVLGKYVREDKLLSLESAVWKLSGFVAQRYGLHDRGLIKEGLLGDLVVFDRDRILDNASFDDPFQKPSGIDYVIKNGNVVVHSNQYSGAVLGKTIRVTSRQQ